jgi:hypothetical protein
MIVSCADDGIAAPRGKEGLAVPVIRPNWVVNLTEIAKP